MYGDLDIVLLTFVSNGLLYTGVTNYKDKIRASNFLGIPRGIKSESGHM